MKKAPMEILQEDLSFDEIKQLFTEAAKEDEYNHLDNHRSIMKSEGNC